MAEHVKKQIDRDAIREHIRGILVALGDDPDREGLKETPDRVARMYEEVFEGMNYTNDEIAEMFDKTFEDELEFSEQSQDCLLYTSLCPAFRRLFFLSFLYSARLILLSSVKAARHGIFRAAFLCMSLRLIFLCRAPSCSCGARL